MGVLIMITSWSPSITDAHMKRCDSSLEDFMDIFKPENVREQATKDGRNYIAGQLLDYTKPAAKATLSTGAPPSSTATTQTKPASTPYVKACDS